VNQTLVGRKWTAVEYRNKKYHKINHNKARYQKEIKNYEIRRKKILCFLLPSVPTKPESLKFLLDF